MVAINLGSFSTQNGRLTAGSVTSGLDSKAVIDAVLKSKETEIKTKKDNITANDKVISTLGTLKNLLSTFRTASNALRSPPGSANSSSDAFSFRNATVSSNTAISGSTYLSVSTDSSALVGNYSISNVVTAKAHTIRKDGFTDRTSSVVGAALTFAAGNFTLNGTSITLATGDSLSDIKFKINAVTDTTGVEADIVQVSSSSFSLILRSSETGVTNDIDEYNEALNQIQFGADIESFSEISAGTDASFQINGQTVTRSSNVIDDVIDNLTFTLLKNTPTPDDGTIVTASVTADTTTVKNSVITFINAYNDLKLFIAKQQERDNDGVLKDTAILGNENSLDTIVNDISQHLNHSVTGLASGALNTLAEIGITFTDYAGDSENPATANILTIDDNKFDTQLSSSLDVLRRVFGFDFIANSSEIGVYERTNAATETSFKLDIDLTRASGNQIRVLNSATSAFLYNMDYADGLLSGKTGTDLEGLTIIYTGDDTANITVTATQGIADRLYNVLDTYLTDITGLVDLTIDKYADLNTRAEDEIERLDEFMTSEREYLIGRFSQLEATVAKFNSVLDYFTALQSAQQANN
jgi:flagellar hook-associated protein 2